MLNSWLISLKTNLLIAFPLPDLDLCVGIVYIVFYFWFCIYLFLVQFLILQVLLVDGCAGLTHMEIVSTGLSS